MNVHQKTTAAIQEPLEDLAWFAFHNAPETCDPAYGCAAYHQLWSLVRLLMRDSKPPRGLSFFAKHLSELGQEDQTVRILVAGSADCGLPTLLANAAGMAGRKPEITVVDRCASPLAQITALAEHTGLNITTIQGELDAVDCRAFDAAVTHNVMLFNTDATRQVIFDRLAESLRTGGRLLSTETVCDSIRPRDLDDIEAQLATITAALAQRGHGPGDVKKVAAAARDFLTPEVRVAAYPEKDLRRHVLSAGLALLSFETQPKGAVKSPRSLNIVEDHKAYAFVAAEKPA